MKRILIIGAVSAIAQAAAKKMAADGCELFLADLNQQRLETVKQDIQARYPIIINISEFDAMQFESHQTLIDKAIDTMKSIDAVLIAYGTLPDQEKARKDLGITVNEFTLNATSIISISTAVANYFEVKGTGTLAVISSVAGDRGRQSNYIYGAAKGAVSIFFQGLRNKLNSKGIKIITIKPGMVDTPMTSHMEKSFLFAKAKTVGEGIYKAMKQGKDIVYLPSYWRCIMSIIKLIPESIFKKLSL